MVRFSLVMPDNISQPGVTDMAATIQLAIKGMTCASCAGRVEKSLLKVPGVLSASVNLATEQVSLTLLPATEDRALKQAVADAGYELILSQASPEAQNSPAQPRR